MSTTTIAVASRQLFGRVPVSSFVSSRSRMVEPTQVRSMATGTRGSRGLGWYVNYRAGKGGRHLQGEYYDRDEQECQEWNQAILELGKTPVYLDIVVEPHTPTVEEQPLRKTYDVTALKGDRYRLTMDLASTVMPETCRNFIDLCQAPTQGYIGSVVYRFEKKVGICGGDVLTNTGKTGKAAQGKPLALDVQEDPLAMWHLPGTVSMLVADVGRIDSRFILCTEYCYHLDGINRAFGQLTEESLEQVRLWQSKILTQNGKPSNFDLIVVEAGLVDTNQTQQVA